MPAPVYGSEIVLHGDVGNCGDGFDYFTAAEIIAALAKVGSGRRATVRLNSGGGIAWDGTAIASAMRAHKGGVDVIVEGIAASAASLIAVSGHTVKMATGAVMMIHDPAGITVGTAESHERSAAELNTLGESYASIYAARTGKPSTDIRRLMKAETWMTAEQAVAEGFADAILAEQPKPIAAFAYTSRYRHPPRQIAAMCRIKAWARRDDRSRAFISPDRQAALANMRALVERGGLKPAG